MGTATGPSLCPLVPLPRVQGRKWLVEVGQEERHSLPFPLVSSPWVCLCLCETPRVRREGQAGPREEQGPVLGDTRHQEVAFLKSLKVF